MENDLSVITGFLERFETGDIASRKGRPFYWGFAVEVEYAFFAHNYKNPDPLIENIRAERIAFRRDQISKGRDDASVLEQEIDRLMNGPEFNVRLTGDAGKDKYAAADVCENLLHCEVNDHCYQQKLVRRRFGTGTFGAGWFDAPRCGELASDGPRPATLVIDEHDRIIEAIKYTGERHGIETRLYNTHLNFSVSTDGCGARKHLVEIGTERAIDLYAKALGGISKAFTDAEPLLNAFRRNARSFTYIETFGVGTHRAKGAFRNSRNRTEHRTLGQQPDIKSAIELILGGAAQAFIADEKSYAEMGMIPAHVVDVPIYRDLSGKNTMMLEVIKAMSLDPNTRALTLDQDHYSAFVKSVVLDTFNGFSEFKDDPAIRLYDYDDFIRLQASTARFFKGLTLNPDGTFDLEKQQENIRDSAHPLLQNYYADHFLNGLREIRFIGTAPNLEHGGYPTEYGGKQTEQRLIEAQDSKLLSGIFGQRLLSEKVVRARRVNKGFQPTG